MNIFQWLWIPLLVLVIVLGIAAIRIYRDARSSKRLVKQLLSTSIKSISNTPDDIRATLFTVRNDDTLSTYSSTASEYDNQDKLRIPLGSGVAGQAWLKSMPVYADFSKDEIYSWNLTPKQMAFANKIRSSLAIPLTDSSGRTIGVLSIDSKLPLNENHLDEDKRVKLAQEFADLISKALVNTISSKGNPISSEITVSPNKDKKFKK
jgi:hypothetical protein